MKPTKIASNGKELYYADLNQKIIQIGDNLRVRANSGSNYGAVLEVSGILQDIDQWGRFVIGGKYFYTENICLHGKGDSNEIWFECFNHSSNGHTYSVEIIS